MSKGRITWTEESVETFLNLLVENKSRRQGGKYNWDVIVPHLNIRTGKEYDKKSVSNFFSDCKNKFLAWDELKTKWTGIGWDDSGCPVIEAEDDKWKAFLKKHKNKPAAFLKRPLMFEDKMYDIFKGTYTKSWAPSAARKNLLDINKEPKNILQEGSGDSREFNEDGVEGRIELSGNESRSPTKTTYSKKRKSLDGVCVSSKKSVKEEIDLCLDVLKKNMNIGSSKAPPSKYERMLEILQNIPEVVEHGKGFIVEVLEFLRDPDCAELFLSLPDNEFRLLFLKKRITFPGEGYVPTIVAAGDNYNDLNIYDG